MKKHFDLKEKRKEYFEHQDEIIDEEEDYFDVNKQDFYLKKDLKRKYSYKRFNKENPYG